ncbi:MAG: hypothetical protein FWD88_06685, partial [Treponema sp.]|nr:hypothetical protein [Treponema sp.]
ALALALVFTACGGDDNGGGAAALGTTLSLGGQVYTIGFDLEPEAFPTNPSLSYARFTDTLEVRSLFRNGTGEVDGGRLGFTVGSPYTEELVSIGYLLHGLEYEIDGLTITPPDALAAFLLLETDAGDLVRGHLDVSMGGGFGMELSAIADIVIHIYVDRDVAITGNGTTFTVEDMGMEIETRPVSMTLRTGWNAIRTRAVATYNMFTNTGNATITMTHSNPGRPIRWLLLDADALDPIPLYGPLRQTPPGTSGVLPLLRTLW